MAYFDQAGRGDASALQERGVLECAGLLDTNVEITLSICDEDPGVFAYGFSKQMVEDYSRRNIHEFFGTFALFRFLVRVPVVALVGGIVGVGSRVALSVRGRGTGVHIWFWMVGVIRFCCGWGV